MAAARRDLTQALEQGERQESPVGGFVSGDRCRAGAVRCHWVHVDPEVTERVIRHITTDHPVIM
ncbi:hypothetical protein [Streptomyces pseudovenezuelae]|uniref:Uncharacterized protein n=1 Tax=Streptomyces pseudovenezuelae TaxID=67350 RepID=A0ABT6LDU8_9ACTN|nr:hypothetical protein [Streptomyces pseudovenezuelae]MDH6214491.1 hypothetical protein [Streptomyces pseudovenezuelae]